MFLKCENIPVCIPLPLHNNQVHPYKVDNMHFLNINYSVYDICLLQNVAEARFVEMKNQVTKAEEKLKREEEKCQGLSTQFQELNAISTTNRTNVKAKLEQIEMLQVLYFLCVIFSQVCIGSFKNNCPKPKQNAMLTLLFQCFCIRIFLLMC